jgi:hypothetical protein
MGSAPRPPAPSFGRPNYEIVASVRLRSADGRWRIDLIRLTATSDNRDGEWLRVHRDGFCVAEVRTVAELNDYLDLADLEEAATAWPISSYRPGSSR